MGQLDRSRGTASTTGPKERLRGEKAVLRNQNRRNPYIYRKQRTSGIDLMALTNFHGCNVVAPTSIPLIRSELCLRLSLPTSIPGVQLSESAIYFIGSQSVGQVFLKLEMSQ